MYYCAYLQLTFFLDVRLHTGERDNYVALIADGLTDEGRVPESVRIHPSRETTISGFLTGPRALPNMIRGPGIFVRVCNRTRRDAEVLAPQSGWLRGEHHFRVEKSASDAGGDGEEIALAGEDFDLAGAGEFGEVDGASSADTGGGGLVRGDAGKIREQFAGVNEEGVKHRFSTIRSILSPLWGLYFYLGYPRLAPRAECCRRFATGLVEQAIDGFATKSASGTSGVARLPCCFGQFFQRVGVG